MSHGAGCVLVGCNSLKPKGRVLPPHMEKDLIQTEEHEEVASQEESAPWSHPGRPVSSAKAEVREHPPRV